MKIIERENQETGREDDGPSSSRSGRAAAASDRPVRLAVNLGPESADVLKEYAARKGVSVTEAIRRAIAVLAYVDEVQRRGAALNVEEGGVLKEVIFLA